MGSADPVYNRPMPRKKNTPPHDDVQITGSVGYGKPSGINADLVTDFLRSFDGQLIVVGKPDTPTPPKPKKHLKTFKRK